MSGSTLQANFFLKKDDLVPQIQSRLVDPSGYVDLTGATVTFRMRLMNTTGARKVDAVASIVDAATGLVQYTWVSGDTDTPGYYDMEWHVVLSNDATVTFPNNGNLRLLITDTL